MATAYDVAKGGAPAPDAVPEVLAGVFVGGRARMLVTLEATPDQLLALVLLAPVARMFGAVDVVVSGMWDDTFAHDLEAARCVLYDHCKLSRSTARVYAGWTAVGGGAPPGLINRGPLVAPSVARVAERMQSVDRAYNSVASRGNYAYDAVVVLGEALELERLLRHCGSSDAVAGASVAMARMPLRTLPHAALDVVRRVYALPREVVAAEAEDTGAVVRLTQVVAERFPDICVIHSAYAEGGFAVPCAREATMLAAGLLLPPADLRTFGLVASAHHATWWPHADSREDQTALHGMLLHAAAEALALPPTRKLQ